MTENDSCFEFPEDQYYFMPVCDYCDFDEDDEDNNKKESSERK